MAFFDMPLAELETYKPTRLESADFDAFWQRSIAETEAHPLAVQFEHEGGGSHQNLEKVKFLQELWL